jgi:S-adenosylmethionine:tRNA-ribosyltransferase-isomerase (queuine synthetase)
MWEVWLTCLKYYGPIAAVLAFFIWQSWVRERQMNSRIGKLEDDQRKVLLPMVARCTKVIAKNTTIMRRLERALDERWFRDHNSEQ